MPNLQNLRPISLLPVPEKILEKCIYNCCKSFLFDHVDNNQFAYRPFGSTTSATILMHDIITKYIDSSEVTAVIVIAFDLSKAFDTVPHHKLLRKLDDFHDIPKSFIRWLNNYLYNRKQRVKLGGALSSCRNVTSGVPQGSLLGPVCFSLYVNDLCVENQIPNVNCTTLKYADDTNVIFPVYRDSDVSNNIASVIDFVSNWCFGNCLKLNKNKTKVLPISKGNIHLEIPDHNEFIVNELLYLGIIFNNQLNWNSHITRIVRICSSRLYALRILKPILSKPNLISVYFSLIRSVIEFSTPTFCEINKKQLQQLNSIQRRAHNIICSYLCHCEILPDLNSRRTYLVKKFFYNIVKNHEHVLHKHLPSVLPSGRMRVEHIRTSKRLNSFFSVATQVFNEQYRR